MEPYLEVKNLTVTYGKKTVLAGIDWRVSAGDCTALIGANGAGKSTLVRAVMGLKPVLSGSVFLFGQPLSRFKQWHRVGYLAQNPGLNPDFPATVSEIVAGSLCSRWGLLRRPGKHGRLAVEAALTQVGLGDKAGVLAGRLSGGERQRMLLARLLVTRPQLLFLDEPATGLDVDSREVLQGILLQLQREGDRAIVVITHHLESVAGLVNSVVSLNGGRITKRDVSSVRQSAAKGETVL